MTLDASLSENTQPVAPSIPISSPSPPRSPPAPVQTPNPVATLAAPISIQEIPPSPISEPPTSPAIVDQLPDTATKPIIADMTANAVTNTEASTSSSHSTLDPAPVVVKAPELTPIDVAKPPRSRQISHSNSTFRHVPARASPLRRSSAVPPPFGSHTHPPSPLVPGSPTLTPTSSQMRTRTIGATAKVHDFSSSALPSPSVHDAQNQVSSSMSLPALSRPVAPSLLSSSSSLRSLKPTTGDLSAPVPPPKSTSASPSPAQSPLPSASPSRPPTSLPSTSSTSTIQHSIPTATSSRSATVRTAPYRHGFQPKGVYGIRTDEFLEARRTKRDVARIEDRRLERRLEKVSFLSTAKTCF